MFRLHSIGETSPPAARVKRDSEAWRAGVRAVRAFIVGAPQCFLIADHSEDVASRERLDAVVDRSLHQAKPDQHASAHLRVIVHLGLLSFLDGGHALNLARQGIGKAFSHGRLSFRCALLQPAGAWRSLGSPHP